MSFCGFKELRPTLLIIGGSTGSVRVNEAIWSCLDKITEKYNVIHLCGKDKTNKDKPNTENYVQFEYIKSELADLLSLADVVVSRAGANAICELLALKKPAVLIPLSLEASRGDQILNAKSFEKSGYSKLLMEEDVNDASLLEAINEVYENRESYIDNMKKAHETDSITKIVELIEEVAK